MQKEIENADIRNVKAGASFLGVSPVTLGRLMSRGEIGYYRIGSRVVFSTENHLLPFLRRNEIQPAGAAIGTPDLTEDRGGTDEK